MRPNPSIEGLGPCHLSISEQRIISDAKGRELNLSQKLRTPVAGARSACLKRLKASPCSRPSSTKCQDPRIAMARAQESHIGRPYIAIQAWFFLTRRRSSAVRRNPSLDIIVVLPQHRLRSKDAKADI
mmetsp:Transcript_44324/g.117571  ORF Transcript_44324/g.117571 Transcript_44324/m.117571 type:complete len:128 (+) Transcript_44324:791-1174(+)